MAVCALTGKAMSTAMSAVILNTAVFFIFSFMMNVIAMPVGLFLMIPRQSYFFFVDSPNFPLFLIFLQVTGMQGRAVLSVKR